MPEKKKPHLSEWLKKIGAHGGYHEVDVINDEERLVQHLVWKVGQIVRNKKQLFQWGFLHQTIKNARWATKFLEHS